MEKKKTNKPKQKKLTLKEQYQSVVEVYAEEWERLEQKGFFIADASARQFVRQDLKSPRKESISRVRRLIGELKYRARWEVPNDPEYQKLAEKFSSAKRDVKKGDYNRYSLSYHQAIYVQRKYEKQKQKQAEADMGDITDAPDFYETAYTNLIAELRRLPKSIEFGKSFFGFIKSLLDAKITKSQIGEAFAMASNAGLDLTEPSIRYSDDTTMLSGIFVKLTYYVKSVLKKHGAGIIDVEDTANQYQPSDDEVFSDTDYGDSIGG